MTLVYNRLHSSCLNGLVEPVATICCSRSNSLTFLRLFDDDDVRFFCCPVGDRDEVNEVETDEDERLAPGGGASVAE